MRIWKAAAVVSLGLCGLLAPAKATVQIRIDLTSQTMRVESSSGSFDWPVSTARSGYHTPRGSFAPTAMERMHYSRKYDMSPMPHAIFFRGGYAIHGSYESGSLGRPASHGCVRLDPANAELLYHMVEAEGASISITGTPPHSKSYRRSHRRLPHYANWPRAHRRRYPSGWFFPFFF